MPPPAEGLAARLVIGPALRTQPDRRLVALVRDGYESAFEEIVRRYGKPLQRYAAAIVGGRAEDVTQDAFSKALLAMRREGNEIDLRPWLFRIVRNAALNDLRDRPPSAESLAEALVGGGRSPAEEMERREELTDLMERLRALPEPQRAAIVMRELEGLSHEEIAAALGLSGGAARQAIYRARQALRDGAALLLPLPLLKTLIDHGGEAAAAGAAGGGAAAASGALGGAGAGMAMKAGVVTAVLAGSVGTGIALQERDPGSAESGSARAAAPVPGSVEATARAELAASKVGGSGDDDSGRGGDGGGARHRSDGDDDGHSGREQAVEAPGEGDHGHGWPNRGPGRHGQEPADGDDSHRGPGHGTRPESGSGPGPRRGGGEVEGEGGSRHDGTGPGSGGSGRDGSGEGPEDRLFPPPPTEEDVQGGDSGSSGPGSGGSGSGSGEDGSGSDSDSSRRGGGEELP